MKHTKNLSFRKMDLIAIVATLLLGIVVFMTFLPQKSAKTANVQVFQDGKLMFEVPIRQDKTFPVEGEYRNMVVIRNQEVFIEDSNCPGKDCVHSGSIHTPGKSIVCLPNRVEIRVTGQSDVDTVVR